MKGAVSVSARRVPLKILDIEKKSAAISMATLWCCPDRTSMSAGAAIGCRPIRFG